MPKACSRSTVASGLGSPHSTASSSIGRQRDVDALERLHEHGAGARQIALPAVRAEVAVEGDLGALLARHLDDGEEAAEPGVGIERQRDAGEVDQPRAIMLSAMRFQSGELEQLARRRLVAPVVEAPLALGVGLDQVEAGQPAGHAQHQVGRDALGRGQRDDAVGIGIVAERGRIGDVDAGARQIDRGVEGVAAAAMAKRPSLPRAISIMTSPIATTRDSDRSW